MRYLITYILVAIIAIFTAGVLNANAQDSGDDEAYWYVTEYKIDDWSKLDSLKTLEQKYGEDVWNEYKKMGHILEYKLLIHDTGGTFNVVRMIKYPNWASIKDAPSMEKAVKKVFSDEEKMDKVDEAYQWIFEGAVHKDNIYTEAAGVH